MLRTIFAGVSKTIEFPLYCAEKTIQAASTVVGGLWGAKTAAMALGLGLGLSMPIALTGAAVGGLASAAFFHAASEPAPFSWSETPTEVAASKPVSEAATVSEKFADAGNPERAAQPSLVSRAITAANDTVQSALKPQSFGGGMAPA